jgi:transcriptional regulator with XRE-family HTH domain
MTVGQRIKQRREALGLTQEELAQKVGYASRSSINKIELSRELPSRKIALMANALDTTPSFLMGWTDDPEPSHVGETKTVESYLNEPIIDVFERKGIKPDQMQDAYQFLEQFLNLPPEKQELVVNLVKLSQSDS